MQNPDFFFRNIFIVVAYKGTNYFGWQKQKKEKTIQSEIESAVFKVLHEKINLTGSGRTDAGVHALGQTANFKIQSQIKEGKLLRALNANLPDDIRIRNLKEVDENFSARYSTKKKTYRYRIYTEKTKSPFEDEYSYFYPYDLNVKFVKKALKYLVGRHDFTSFSSIKDMNKSKIRTIKQIHVYKTGWVLNVEFIGNGFLYNMIRIIMGTVIDLHMHKRSPSEMKKILQGRNRDLAGPTLSPKGLFLVDVKY